MRHRLFAGFLAVFLLVSGCSSTEQASVSEEASDASEESREEESAPLQVALEQPVMEPEEARALLADDDGAGTISVSSRDHLIALSCLVNSGDTDYKQFSYIQQGDIDMNGLDFTPIGGLDENSEGCRFEAAYDGGNYLIMGLTVRDRFHESGTGLFGAVGPEGRVSNTHVTGGNIRGRGNVGGIAGSSNGTLEHCSFRGKVFSSSENAGGIAGLSGEGSQILRCFSNAEVTGSQDAGGLVGLAEEGALLTDCYALGSVTADAGSPGAEAARIGGFIGANRMADIRRCYSNTEVYTNAHAALVGGFAGYSESEFTACYYNHTATANWKTIGQAGEEERFGVTAYETLELCEQDTYSGWDFSAVWDIADDKNRRLPFLR